MGGPNIWVLGTPQEGERPCRDVYIEGNFEGYLELSGGFLRRPKDGYP